MKKFIGYAFFCLLFEVQQRHSDSFSFSNFKERKDQRKVSGRCTLHKAAHTIQCYNNNKCSSGGYPPHLLGYLTLVHMHLLESQVSMLQSMSTPTLLFTSNKPSHLASASLQTPLTAFHSLSLFCFLGFSCDENCLFITNKETLMNLLKKKNGFDGLFYDLFDFSILILAIRRVQVNKQIHDRL